MASGEMVYFLDMVYIFIVMVIVMKVNLKMANLTVMGGLKKNDNDYLFLILLFFLKTIRYTTSSKVVVEGLFSEGKPQLTLDKLRESDRPFKERFETWRKENASLFEQRRKLHQEKFQK